MPNRPVLRPPGRRDSRRPGPRRLPRELQPHHWFAERLLLALSGQKPAHWLLNDTIGAAYDQVFQLAAETPLRGTGPEHPALLHCGTYRPKEGVIEAFARIEADGRVRAMAFRLELGPDHRWRCAAVEVAPASRPDP